MGWYQFPSLTLIHCQLEIDRTHRHGGNGFNAAEGCNSLSLASGFGVKILVEMGQQ